MLTKTSIDKGITSGKNVRLLSVLLISLLLIPAVQGQGASEALLECPSTLTGSTQPQQIHLQTTENPSEMNVLWATERRGNAEVQWDGQSAMGESYCYNHDMAFHLATMTGLEPGEEVSYRVGDGNTWSSEISFTTIDPEANRFEWISIADHGISGEADLVSDAILADSDAQMVTISGDISYANGDQSIWDDYFNFNQESMQNIPWMTSVGNHENEPGIEFEAYQHRFDSEGEIEVEPFWYSRNLPGVHMIFMSSEHPYDSSSAQFSWLENDFSTIDREITPFVIVYSHKPMYSSNSYHGSEFELRESLESLFITNQVDIVIAGHDHFYERTHPVKAEVVQAAGEAPVHLVIGVGGRDAYEELDEPQPEWSAYRENNTYGWTRLVYDGEAQTLDLTHHRTDGTIGDSFTLYVNQPIIEPEENYIYGFESFFTLLVIIAAAGRKGISF